MKMRVQIKTWDKMVKENSMSEIDDEIIFTKEVDYFTAKMEEIISKYPNRIIDVEIYVPGYAFPNIIDVCGKYFFFSNELQTNVYIYASMIEKFIEDEDKKVFNIYDVDFGRKFTLGTNVYVKIDRHYEAHKNLAVNIHTYQTENVSNAEEINLNWWEADYFKENKMTQIEIMQARQDGAKIEYYDLPEEHWRKCITPLWNWLTYDYRVAPQSPTHKITIDGKEIKLSEESYNELKKSLT